MEVYDVIVRFSGDIGVQVLADSPQHAREIAYQQVQDNNVDCDIVIYSCEEH